MVKVTTSLDQLDTGLSTVSSLVKDKFLPESEKNVILWLKGDEVRLLGNNTLVTSYTVLDAQVEFEGEEAGDHLIPLRASEVMNVVSALRGLHKTVISKIEIISDETGVRLKVYEAPVDEFMENAKQYVRESTYRMTVVNIKKTLRDTLASLKTDLDYETLTTPEVLVYLNALLPTIIKEVNDNVTSRMYVTDKYMYTYPKTHLLVMCNQLPSVFSDFVLTGVMADFLKGFISKEDTFLMHKDSEDSRIVTLTLKNSTSVAVMRAMSSAKAFNIDSVLTAKSVFNATSDPDVPVNGIITDKTYLCDVLRRMSLNQNEVNMIVDIDNQVFSIESQTLKQDLPLMGVKGSGRFEFTIRPEVLGMLIMSYTTFLETVMFFFEKQENGVSLMVTDSLRTEGNVRAWRTHVKRLTYTKGDFHWN